MRRVCCTVGLFALLFLLAATPSYAQLEAGIKGGINFANLSFDPSDDECCDINTRFAIGGFVEAPVKPNLGVLIEVLYNQGGGKYSDGSDAKINFDSIQIPILLDAKFGGGSARPFVVIGPGMGFVTGAKIVDDDGNVFVDLKEDDEVESFQFSLIFGAGVHVGPATIEARYDLGLSNLAKDSDDSVKSRTFSILVGYGFGKK